MFTGIIKEVGEVEALDRDAAGARLRVRAALAARLGEGDSVAVSGACLTVAAAANGAFEADVMNQTLGVTTLGRMAPGARVNLEPALRAGDPLGGHIVQGHIDGTGEVAEARDDGFARRVRIAMPPELRSYVVEHGSIAVDGVSLTVAALAGDGCEVSLIPETLERTTLARLAAGDAVNLEVDLIARYAERLMQGFTVSGRKRNA
jgi:riboflavin synthase